MIIYVWFSVINCLARVKKSRWNWYDYRYCVLLLLWEFWDWVGVCDTFHVTVIWWSQSCMMMLCMDGVLLIFNFECMMMVLFLICNVYAMICLLLLWRVPFGSFYANLFKVYKKQFACFFGLVFVGFFYYGNLVVNALFFVGVLIFSWLFSYVLVSLVSLPTSSLLSLVVFWYLLCLYELVKGWCQYT